MSALQMLEEMMRSTGVMLMHDHEGYLCMVRNHYGKASGLDEAIRRAYWAWKGWQGT